MNRNVRSEELLHLSHSSCGVLRLDFNVIYNSRFFFGLSNFAIGRILRKGFPQGHKCTQIMAHHISSAEKAIFTWRWLAHVIFTPLISVIWSPGRNRPFYTLRAICTIKCQKWQYFWHFWEKMDNFYLEVIGTCHVHSLNSNDLITRTQLFILQILHIYTIKCQKWQYFWLF